MKRKHDCPSCTCGLVELHWSDREAWVDPTDLDEVAQAVVSCALDHSYDRGDGVPYGLEGPTTAALLAVVAEHLSAVRSDWRERTVDMNTDQRAALLADVKRVLVEELRKEKSV